MCTDVYGINWLFLKVFRFGAQGPRTFKVERSRARGPRERSKLNVRALRAPAKKLIAESSNSSRSAANCGSSASSAPHCAAKLLMLAHAARSAERVGHAAPCVDGASANAKQLEPLIFKNASVCVQNTFFTHSRTRCQAKSTYSITIKIER